MTIDRWLRIVFLRLRSVFRRRDVERDLDEELQYHLERQTAENVRSGMAPDVARAGVRWVEELPRDVGFGVRALRRAPGFSIAVVLTLALGIGANTAMFTLLRGTLLRPLPNRDGERLVYLRQSAQGPGQENVLFSVPEIADYRAASKTLAAIAEYSSVLPFTLVGGGGAPVRVRTGIVSGNYFDVMGLAPVLGRRTPRSRPSTRGTSRRRASRCSRGTASRRPTGEARPAWSC